MKRAAPLVAILILLGCGPGPMNLALDAGVALDASGPADLVFRTAAHPAFPTLPKGNGKLLSPLTVVTITTPGDPLAADLEAFADELITSMWWKQVGIDAYQLPAPTQSLHFTGPAITANIDDDAIQAYIAAVINANPSIAFNDKTVYLLYLPDNIAVIEQGQVNKDCDYYEGYHGLFNNGNQVDNYAVIQRCYHNTKEGLDDVTNTASHEIIESATDPDGDGWILPDPASPPPAGDVWLAFGTGGENADLCVATTYVEGKYQYQRVWSNAAAQAGGDPCVPALPEPYWNTSPAQGWYPVAPGETVDIPIVGWSTAPRADWYLELDRVDANINGFTASIQADREFTKSVTYPAINNGETAHLKVTAPVGAPSGGWVVFDLYSTSTTASADWYHEWPIGVFIP